MAKLREVLSLVRLRTWVLFSALVVGTIYVLIVWTLRRGFDWTDESWANSLIASDRVTTGEAWGYQHLLHPLFELFGESVLAFRWLRLAAYVSLAVLSTALLARVSSVLGFVLRRWEWWLVLLFAQVGTFLAWSYPPRYFAYNELSAWFAQVGALLLVVLLTGSVASRISFSTRVRMALWGAVGLIAVLLTAAKFTSGIVFGGVALVVLVLGDSVLGWVRRTLASVGGVALGLLWLPISGFPVSSYASGVERLLFDRTAQAENGHSLRPLLESYKDSLFETSQMVIVPVALFAVALGLLLAGPVLTNVHRRLLTTGGVTFAILTAVTIVSFPRIPSFPTMGRFILLIGEFAAIAFVAVGASGSTLKLEASARSSRRVRLMAVAILVATPFIGAAGTDNLLMGQLLYSSTIWCVVLAIALVVVARRLEDLGSKSVMIPPAFVLLLIMVSGVFVVGQTLQHPYRSTPYQGQSYATKAPHLQHILLTKDEAEWADWVAEQAVALDAEDVPTLSIASPGALLVFNNSAFAGPWLVEGRPATFNSIESACESATPSDLIVLQPGFSGPDSGAYGLLAAALENGCGIQFPGDFSIVAERTSPNPQYQMTIWRRDP